MLLARVFGDLSPSKTLKLPVAIRTEEIYLEINIFRGVKYVITEINMSPIDHWGIVRTNFFSSARGNLQTFQIKCFSLIQRLILRYVGWNSASRLWDRLLQFSISLFLVTKFSSWTCLQMCISGKHSPGNKHYTVGQLFGSSGFFGYPSQILRTTKEYHEVFSFRFIHRIKIRKTDLHLLSEMSQCLVALSHHVCVCACLS